jgi:hypothetical protein
MHGTKSGHQHALDDRQGHLELLQHARGDDIYPLGHHCYAHQMTDEQSQSLIAPTIKTALSHTPKKFAGDFL